MADELIEKSIGKGNIFIDNVKTLSEPENFQKYILGYKKNGYPRAVYDIVKECTGLKDKKKKKKNKKKKASTINAVSFYTDVKGGKKKKKKKKKNNKYWHI